MKTKQLLFEQLERKMNFLSGFSSSIPTSGWINSIRKALGISAQQLANKLNVSRQGVTDMEKREAEGAITLKSLKEIANKLDMELVYGFVPKTGSLDLYIETKARELAEKIVNRTSNSMKLEDQENSSERIRKSIDERTDEFRKTLPKALWD
ncbi:mobile mystery protein A [Algoriphagus sp.]|uniref:mobile mystery protein A n=1 Tax=Algoriphagus sp. TaxID=1872435 RepID=UPI00391D8DD4